MILRSGLVVVAALILAGCSDSSSNRATPPMSVDFTTFVKDEINNTRDDRNAVSINGTEFSFNDQDNEQAFDDLL